MKNPKKSMVTILVCLELIWLVSMLAASFYLLILNKTYELPVYASQHSVHMTFRNTKKN